MMKATPKRKHKSEAEALLLSLMERHPDLGEGEILKMFKSEFIKGGRKGEDEVLDFWLRDHISLLGRTGRRGRS